MKAIAINGSPRRNWNTDTLLKKALKGANYVGAETELIHLYNLNFKGCSSCFLCKKKNNKFPGYCALRDDLSEVLERVITSNVLFLGSPIYLGNITGDMKSFLERLIFMNLSYDSVSRSNFKGKISTGFIYTMGIPHGMVEAFGYHYLFDVNKNYLQLLNGSSEYITSADNYQFENYQNYAASNFNEKHKAAVREQKFPAECKKAFEMGVRLCSQTF